MQTAKAELLQGTLNLLILKTLHAGPLHGCAILQSIHRNSYEILAVEEGSLYPCLQRMGKKGWISAEWGVSQNNRRAKFYSITRAGRKQLEEETANWERASRAMALVLQAQAP